MVEGQVSDNVGDKPAAPPAAEGLIAPSRQEVLAQQERKSEAPAAEAKAQIDREAPLQTLTAPVAPEQRSDTSGDMFAMEKAQAEIDNRNAGVAVESDPNQGGFGFDDGPQFSRSGKSKPQTETPAFKTWFEGSKVVDSKGKPLMVFHGTPNASFTVFKEGAHFTEDPDYAAIYANPSASSISSQAKRADAPATMPVYLAIKKPFDTRIPSVRRVFEREFFNKYGNGTPLSKRGLPDWTDARDLLEWIEETGQPFDGLLIDEGGTPAGGHRGLSWVPVKSAQIKSATGNNGNFDGGNSDINFSRAAKADETKDLVIQHNLSAENLLHADRMGGLAVPSLAITKVDSPMEGFGEITLIGDRNMADPKQGIKAYGADIYSPRYPTISYDVTPKALASLNEMLAPYKKEGDRPIYGSEIGSIEDLTQNSRFRKYAMEKLGKTDVWDLSFHSMQPLAGEMLQAAGATERLFQGFTNNGNRKYKAHTLENVIAILKKDLRGGENFNYGAGSLRAKFTPQFRSIEAIKKAKGTLVSKEQFETVKDEVNNELLSIADSLNKPTDTAIAIFEDAPRMGLKRAAAQYDIDLGDEMASRMAEFMTRLRNMPTEYFEGKFLRSVGVSEFKAAVVPDNVSEKVLALLKRDGVQVFTYKKDDPADRARVIKEAAQSQPDTLFSRNKTPSVWRSALEDGVASINAKAQPGEGWREQINGLVKKGTVKADEVEWTGVTEWLQLQDGKVTKEQVLDYLDGNGVQVEETVLKDGGYMLDAAGRRIDDGAGGFVENGKPTKYSNYQLPGGENYRELLLTLPEKRITQRKKLEAINNQYDSVLAGRAISELSDAERAAVNRLTKEHDSIADAEDVEDYKSNHWDQKNILAHIRFNERIDSEGKRVLFIEEIQSDFGQQAKKEGFAFNDADQARLTEVEKQLALARNAGEKYRVAQLNSASGVPEYWVTKGEGRNAVYVQSFSIKRIAEVKVYELNRDESEPDVKALYKERDELENRKSTGRGVPRAPFVGKTDAWVALAIKRMISYASANGFDKIAFVNGEQSAERYALSKQVDQVSYERVNNSKPTAYRVKFVAVGQTTFENSGVHAASDLENVVGKEIAKRIIDDETGSGTLRGLDLRVGGTGMIAFYNQIVPKVAKDVLKKLGGGQMGVVSMRQSTGTGKWVVDDAAGDYAGAFKTQAEADQYASQNPGYVAHDGSKGLTQPGFDITPAMREKAAAGLPLFSFAGQQAKGANTLNLLSAQRQVNEGADPDTVRQQTGWHRGIDGRWRFEISDNQAQVQPTAKGTSFGAIHSNAQLALIANGQSGGLSVADVLAHDRLYAAYPGLQYIPLGLMPAGSTATAKLNRAPGGMLTVMVAEKVPRAEVASAILHELQHAIQNIEGFAQGGSSRTPAIAAAASQDLRVKTGSSNYQRLAGEIEARNTQARMGMTAAERSAIGPEFTADTPDDQAIVTFNGRDTIKAPQPENAQPAPAQPLTLQGLKRAIAVQFPKLAPALDKMLERGSKGQKGGLIMLASNNPVDIAEVYASKTGRAFSDTVRLFSEGGDINGFYDAKTGLTFLVGPNLDAVTGVAVMLHEMVHGQQNKAIDAKALALLDGRAKQANADTRAFLDRVAAQIEASGESGNAKESASYIVEQAVKEGRSAGFAVANSKFLAWVDKALGKGVGDLLRSVLVNVRAWQLRHGLTIGEITVDDLVGYALVGTERASRGQVLARAGKEAFSFAGEKAQTADKMTLGEAQRQIASGVEAETVRQQTGWAKGAEGKWRFEIDDDQASLISFNRGPDESFREYATRRLKNATSQSFEINAASILNHPRLFAAYPKLKTIPVFTSYNDAGGSFDGTSISISAEAKAPRVLSILLHELQHAIQTIEGFASGGSPTQFAKNLPDGGFDNGFQNYRRLAGEVEARNTEARQGMNSDQRKATAPNATADTPDSDVIVVFNGMAMANMPIPDNAALNKSSAGNAQFSRRAGNAQTETPAFKKWFGDSKVVDADGKPLVVYHGTAAQFNAFDPSKIGSTFEVDDTGFFFTSNQETAEKYADAARAVAKRRGVPGSVRTVDTYLSLQNPWTIYVDTSKDTGKSPIAHFESGDGPFNRGQQNTVQYAVDSGYDGLIIRDKMGIDADHEALFIAFQPTQIKSATGNNGDFDSSDPDIRFSRSSKGTPNPAQALSQNTQAAIKATVVTSIKQKAAFKVTDWRGISLQALGGRQIEEIYRKDLPELSEYTRMVQQMSADSNQAGAEADQIATAWGKVKDQTALAEMMHDATLAQIDPAKAFVVGDDEAQWKALSDRFNALSPEAKSVYKQARDAYEEHLARVRDAVRNKIERSALASPAKADMLARMDGEFFKQVKGVYFPLARFGKYVVVVRDAQGKAVNVSRAETSGEADALRQSLAKDFPAARGYAVGKVLRDKEFNAARDAVGRGFLKSLFGVLDESGDASPALQDAINQIYLSSLPDLSWAKHGIHRKGTPGYSQDARRAFAQNMFHGGSHLAKLNWADQLQTKLDDMQESVETRANDPAAVDFDPVKAQQVVDEVTKRNDSLMNPKSNPLSTALTSLGFVFHLGLSPASAMVNLTQTALIAYPVMAGRWGYTKSAAALLLASQQALKGVNDITKSLTADEMRAYQTAVDAGTIDTTQAHDLAGISQGEDAGMAWKLRPVMKAASFMFHHAERFNRQVTFVASYRLAREAGSSHETATAQATKATYDGHFDYSSSNRARFMQGNVAKVILLFKQFAQNTIYTFARTAQQAINGLNPEDRSQARKTLSGLLVMHAAAAGVLGLPMVTTLLAAASMIGGSDDEPWDAETALRNTLAETFGNDAAQVMARGFSRLTPFDISGRVGLDKLIFPDIQEGLEGQRWGESFATAALGAVAGIGINLAKGAQLLSDGDFARGIEAMMPAALRGPVKALRYELEGAKDKTGVVIKDDVSMAGVVGQALGLSPTEVRIATEGRSAIMSADRRLSERRKDLMSGYAKAAMANDTEGVAQARLDIAKFNGLNPDRRINPIQLANSVRSRTKRIADAENGVYLPAKRQGAMEAGRFAQEVQ